MPTELHLLLPRLLLPTTPRWQSALDALSLPVTLDPAFSPTANAGSLPATLRGRPATFEFHLTPSSHLHKSYPGLKGMFPTRDLAATFRFGPDPTESACALAALAALAHLTQSPYFDPREGACHAPDSALTHALPPSPRPSTSACSSRRNTPSNPPRPANRATAPHPNPSGLESPRAPPVRPRPRLRLSRPPPHIPPPTLNTYPLPNPNKSHFPLDTPPTPTIRSPVLFKSRRTGDGAESSPIFDNRIAAIPQARF